MHDNTADGGVSGQEQADLWCSLAVGSLVVATVAWRAALVAILLPLLLGLGGFLVHCLPAVVFLARGGCGLI